MEICCVKIIFLSLENWHRKSYDNRVWILGGLN